MSQICSISSDGVSTQTHFLFLYNVDIDARCLLGKQSLGFKTDHIILSRVSTLWHLQRLAAPGHSS